MATNPNFDEVFGQWYADAGDDVHPAEAYIPGGQEEEVYGGMPDFDRIFAEAESPPVEEEVAVADSDWGESMWTGLKAGYAGLRAGQEAEDARRLAALDVGDGTTSHAPGTLGAKLDKDMPEFRKQLVQTQLDKSNAFASTAESLPPTKELTAFLDEESDKTIWEALKEAPVQIITELGARSLPHMAPGMAAGAAAGVAAGPLGFASGMGAGSARVDFAATMMEQLRERGVDPTDADALIEYVKTDEYDQLVKDATKRSVAVGGMDFLAGLVGGKVLTAGVKNKVLREISNLGIQMPLQAGAGAAGETIGQLAMGVDKLKPREIAAEAVGELVTAPVDIAAAAYSARADTEAKPDKPGALSELDKAEKETEQLGADIDTLKAMNAEELAGYQQQVRADVASKGGDQLEQELAAAEAGRDAGQVLDSEVESLTRLWNKRQAIDEEARYAEDQVKEDEARAKVQEEASKRYEAGVKQVASDKQAAADRARISERVETRKAEGEKAVVSTEKRQTEEQQRAVTKTRAAEKADAKLRKLRRRRQELGLEPKTDLEGQSPYPSDAEVKAYKGGKSQNLAMAEALAKATKQAEEKGYTRPVALEELSKPVEEGRSVLADLGIVLENPAGTTRKGPGWTQKMRDHYGFIPATQSAEGKTEELDVFVGKDVNSGTAFVVDQVNEDGSFDEHKVMLGFPNEFAARRGYMRNNPKGRKVGEITTMPMEKFKQWAKTGGKTAPLKPIAVEGKKGGVKPSRVLLRKKEALKGVEIDDKGDVTLHHYSQEAGLAELDPAMYGTGKPGGEMRVKKAHPKTWKDRTYFYMDTKHTPEQGLGNKQYTAKVSFDKLYNIDADPANLREAATEGTVFDSTRMDQLILDKGYLGFWTDNPQLGKVAAVFEKTRVTEKGRPSTALRLRTPGLLFDLKEKGGFTVDTKGKPVKKGFAVGQGMEAVIEGEVTRPQLDAFIVKHGDALSKEGNTFGGWYDKDSGKTFLDVSRVFDTREEGIAAGRAAKELAIFDLESGVEIRLDVEGDKYFSEAALKEPHVQMRPADFLSVAESLKFAISQKEADLRTILDTQGEKLSSLPVLTVKDGKVVGHEGRHRAMELLSRGVETIPVRIVGQRAKTITSQDGKRSIPFPAEQNGRGFTSFFSDITKGLIGKSSTGKEYTPVISAVAENLPVEGTPQNVFVKEYSNFRGNFDDHIAFSIPGFKEVQIAVGTALAKVYGKGATILDIGASEGSFVKAITSVSGARTVALDPNESMQETFNATPVEGSEFTRAAFGTREQEGALAWPEDEDGPATNYFDPKGEKFDAVHEAMTFQFVSPERKAQIKQVKQLLKTDGVAVIEEKMFTNAQEPNEAKKNEYKRQYFQQEDINEKATEILEGMNANTVHQETLERELTANFNHVSQFWDSGNFKGYVVSDNAMAAAKVLSAIGSTQSEFSTTETPRKVKAPDAVRADIQLRKVDKFSAKVDKAEADVVVKELNDKLPGLKVNLLETPYALPDGLFDKVMNDFGMAGMEARGLIDSKTGEIYVFSKSHSTLDDLVSTVMHEGVGHKGLRVLFNDEQRGELLDSVFAGGDRAALNRIAKSYGLDSSVVEDQRLIADEYVAEMAEKNIDASIMQRVIAAVREVLRKLGLLETWTDSDIKALLRRTRSSLKDGKPLSKIKLRTEMEVEETGEIVTVEQTASVALRQLDKRIEVMKKLRGCVG